MAIKKKQPEPPKKKYTAKDSAQLVGTMRRLEVNTAKAKKKNFEDPVQNYRIREQMDSVSKNSSTPTYIERENKKKGSGGYVSPGAGPYSKPASGKTLKNTPAKAKKPSTRVINPDGTKKMY